MTSLWQDIQYGLRVLAKRPAFTFVAVLTLALGIGSTSAVFSVVDRILFRSLPYPHDEQLVVFGLFAPIEPREFMLAKDYVEWRAVQTPFSTTTTLTPGGADCDLTERSPLRLSCGLVESNFLPTFEIQPILGRNFTKEEDRPRAPRVALIAFGLWRSRFASDPGVVGKNISVDGKPTTIVGVLPADFEMPTLGKADMLMPQALDEAALQRSGPQVVLRAYARLKPGVTIAQAHAALEPLFEKSLQYVPPEFRKEVRLSVRSLRDRQMADAKVASWILFGAVFAVLLVACTNVANLLLARGSSREKELAVRAALGASSARLVRQSLTESLLLGIIGGTVGSWVAYSLLRLFESIAPEGIPHLQQAGLDARVLVFTLVVSLASGVLFGVVPALRKPSSELLAGKEARQTTRVLLRQILVASQVAVSLILLTSAGLLLQSLWKLEALPLGMNAQNVVTAQIALAEYRYPTPERQVAFFDRLEGRLQQVPGVTAVGLSDTLPPSGGMRATIYSQIETPGRPRPAEGTGGMVGWRSVSPGYFQALGVPIIRGRTFTVADQAAGENPLILSETLAARLFPGEDALGKSLRFGLIGPWRQVVGIAADVRNNELAESSVPEYYVLWKADTEGYFRVGHLTVKSALSPETASTWLRQETASLDPSVPVTIERMTERVGKLAERPRFNAILLSLFAGLGVVLAAIGIYGVVGFLVGQRTREIGVRMALGASPKTIWQMVMGQVARWTVAGAALGLLGSWYTVKLLRSLVFETSVRNPWAAGAAFSAILVAAFLAAWVPARRAMRVDPIEALRYE
ncbi:MAG TPA: ABC transporter permease [Candidatus Methylomirabilis sp.]|nr:ABC transporter permease [Candidatus Methylomirabilis sp.]